MKNDQLTKENERLKIENDKLSKEKIVEVIKEVPVEKEIIKEVVKEVEKIITVYESKEVKMVTMKAFEFEIVDKPDL